MHGAVLEILLAAFLIPDVQLVHAGGSQGCAGLAEEPCMGQWQPKELLELCPGGAALC